MEAGITVPKMALKRAYEAWCENAGIAPIAPRFFPEAIKKAGIQEGRGTGGVRYWKGVRLFDSPLEKDVHQAA